MIWNANVAGAALVSGGTLDIFIFFFSSQSVRVLGRQKMRNTSFGANIVRSRRTHNPVNPRKNTQGPVPVPYTPDARLIITR